MAFFKKGETNDSKKETNVDQVKKLLVEGETIENMYRSVEEFLFITNKRIIIYKNNLSIKEPKVDTMSIPIDKIDSFGISKGVAISDFIIYSRGKEYKIGLIEKEVDTSELYILVSKKIL